MKHDKEKARYDDWDLFESLNAVQAAYLWFGIEPPTVSFEPAPLVVDRLCGEIVRSMKLIDGDTPLTLALTRDIPREKLKEFAKSKGVLPAFLYPEERSLTRTATSGQHVSSKLTYLIQASEKFWKNADPKDTSTHPRTAEVVKWLVQRGLSASQAAKGAGIIRPEWAPAGRKPSR